MKPTLPWILFYLASTSLLRPTEAPDVPFEHVVIDPKPPENPWIKIVADLNGDGKPDIIIGGSKGPLVWYRNPDGVPVLEASVILIGCYWPGQRFSRGRTASYWRGVGA